MCKHVDQRRRRADANAFRIRVDTPQIREVLQTYHTFRRNDILFQTRNQVGTTGEDFRFPPSWCKKAYGLRERFWCCKFERIHASFPPFSRAARTRSAVSGSVATRTPHALATAFEIAAPGEITGGSPNPITPRPV